MKIASYSLPLVAFRDVLTPLYPHQAFLLDEWDKHESFMLVTRTGSGKTRAAALPILCNRQSAIFVYPTKALIADQGRALGALFTSEKIDYREVTPANVDDKYGHEEYRLIQIDGELLEEYRRHWALPRKGDALKKLLFSDKRRIVLINPDILFLLFTLRYRHAAEAIAAMQDIGTVVFDEFHLYAGVELAHSLFMIHLARQLKVFQRIVLLTATPSLDVRQLLDALLAPKVIDADVSVEYPTVGHRVVAHEVQFESQVASGDPVDFIAKEVLRLRAHLEALRTNNAVLNSSGEYIPCLIILDSVVSAIALEDLLVSDGISRSDIAPIRGLTARRSRDTANKLVAIGTSAIEVGVDFQTDYLIFEAGDSTSFLQRFGRLARHRPGTAIFMYDYREEQFFSGMGTEVSRVELQEQIEILFPKRDSRAWFCKTYSGIVTACAQAWNFKQQVASQWGTDEKIKRDLGDWIDGVLYSYSTALSIPQTLKRAKRDTSNLWFQHYAAINKFRTSLPSVRVFDKSERDRGREHIYDTDVKTLLRRAEGLRFDPKTKQVVVNGYHGLHSVCFAKSFANDESVGLLQTTCGEDKRAMEFVQDGHRTLLSNIMHHPEHHLFFVAHSDIISHLDWRIAWFPCGRPDGRYIIAFDGDALLLKEIYDRTLQEYLIAPSKLI